MPNSSTPGVREAILAANQKFMRAFADRDAVGMAALYTRNGQLLPPNSDFVTGAPAIQAFWQAIMDMGIKAAQLETVEVEGSGESAYEVGKYTLFVIRRHRAPDRSDLCLPPGSTKPAQCPES